MLCTLRKNLSPLKKRERASSSAVYMGKISSKQTADQMCPPQPNLNANTEAAQLVVALSETLLTLKSSTKDLMGRDWAFQNKMIMQIWEKYAKKFCILI